MGEWTAQVDLEKVGINLPMVKDQHNSMQANIHHGLMNRNTKYICNGEKFGCNYNFSYFPNKFHFFVRVRPIRFYLDIGMAYPRRPMFVVNLFGHGVAWVGSVPKKYYKSKAEI